MALFLITVLPILKVNAITVLDETGTLANAAFLSGRNWHRGEYYYINGAEYSKKGQDVLLVKGDDLKEELELRGYSLTLYKETVEENNGYME